MKEIINSEKTQSVRERAKDAVVKAVDKR